MSWQSLKEHYLRFKRWQREPIQYIQGEEEHRCANCGLTFTGHYCPTCSQRAGLGSIGWHSVSRGVMDMWGLGTRSRSVLYSVWKLLLRPGYLISDYISGKRQVSFPPIKMLFIISVAYAIAFHWLFPELKALGYGFDFREAGFTALEAKKIANMSKPFFDWYETHFGWVMLILSLLIIIPTWVLFRDSPRHTRHTLPEGFFIQVFLANLQVIIFLLLLPCWFFFNQITIMTILTLIVLAYFAISYMQLFGYSLWGTVWRQIFVYGFVSSISLLLMHWLFYLGHPSYTQVIKGNTLHIRSFYALSGVLFLGIGYIINRIATRKARARQKR